MKSANLNHALNGQVIVTNTSAVNGVFGGMLVVADAVVSAMTWSKNYDNLTTGDWTTLGTIPAGTYLPGLFTSLTLTSGKVILYRYPEYT